MFSAMFTTIQFSALLPAWLIVLLAAGLLATLAWGLTVMLRKCIPPQWVMALGVLRLGVIGVFLLALLQPVLSSNRTVQPLPELLVLIDTSASMKEGGGEGKTRLQEATAVLQDGDLARALAQRFRPHWFRFDSTAKSIKAAGLGQLQADGAATHVGDSLLGAHEHLRALGYAPTRVLLVSDGNDLGMTDPVETARRIGLAMDVLAPTATASPKIDRVFLTDVQGARRVLLGSETHFRLTFTGPSSAAKDRAFALHFREDGKPLKEIPLTMKAGQAERVFTLAHRPVATGLKQYEFQIVDKESPPMPPGKLAVQVLDSKYDILVLEDTWRWEYKFLHRLFEDDPSFRFTALLPRGNTFVQFGSPDRRVNLIGFPQNRSELKGSTCSFWAT
jgi:hypothetical protein